MSSTYGENLHLTIFGQSQSPAIGVTVEGRRMRLAKDGQIQIFAVGAAHKPSPFKLSKSSQKRG